MAYYITGDCLDCGICNSNCPVEAITFGADGKKMIDQEKCVQCGTCFDNCPAEAIEEK